MVLLPLQRFYAICLVVAVGEAILSGALVAVLPLVDTKRLRGFWLISLVIAALLVKRIFSTVALMTNFRNHQRGGLFSQPCLLFYFYGALLSFLAVVGYAWAELQFVTAIFEQGSSPGLRWEWRPFCLAFLNCVLSGLWAATCWLPWVAMRRKTPVPKMATFKLAISSSQEQDLPESACVICMEDFKFRQRVGRLACGHTFHKNCICRWFESGGSRCPMRCGSGVSAPS